ncbi:uncharacterized protein LOC115765710 [Drosophila novamexicana]|uniref:uncharacterized protein LOC115765710 n=1 Tax=Drosophila novamexicana TaxID=47314 RepID=UPI0011E5AE6F|nr:uncharacterized protein LOC115765710 [Drosophila novamexicana]
MQMPWNRNITTTLCAAQWLPCACNDNNNNNSSSSRYNNNKRQSSSNKRNTKWPQCNEIKAKEQAQRILLTPGSRSRSRHCHRSDPSQNVQPRQLLLLLLHKQ